MIVDCHVHTYHSYDSLMKPRKIIRLAKKRGLTGIIVSDHDTIAGGLEAQQVNSDPEFRIIVGAEVNTDAGDIMGINLTEEINVRAIEEVIDEIHRQGGLAILVHPYKAHKLEKIPIEKVDIIEGYNGRLSESDNRKAVELANRYGKPIIAGTDAHRYGEIGKCRTTVSKGDLTSPLSTSYHRVSHLSVMLSQYVKAWKHGKPLILFRATLYFIKNALLVKA